MAEFNPAVRINPKKFNIQDIEFLMDATGKDSLEEIFEVFEKESAKVTKELLNTVANLVFVSQRKANPDFTLADAKSVTVEQFQEAMQGASEEDEEPGKAGPELLNT